MTQYNYNNATQRNIGLFSQQEQDSLKHKCIAIAGIGAVGGSYLMTLARMGIQHFKIADPDIFETANLQRQAGAFISTLNQSKVNVMKKMILDINPHAKIELYEKGIHQNNIEDFLDKADLVLDGIDAFRIEIRRMLLTHARNKGLYVFSSGPIAYGASLQIYSPKGMSFDEYYKIKESMTNAEKTTAFLLGSTPNLLRRSPIDPESVDFEKERGPAIASTVALCQGIICTEVFRFFFNRNSPKCIPHLSYFDPYNREYLHRKRKPFSIWGSQKFLLKIAFSKFPSLKLKHEQELLLREDKKQSKLNPILR